MNPTPNKIIEPNTVFAKEAFLKLPVQ